MYGLSDEEIAAIRVGRIAGFAAAEVALLAMADAMADAPSNLNDQLYGDLRKHFSEEQATHRTRGDRRTRKLSRAIQPSIRCRE